MSVRSAPLICSGHSRPVPDLHYSPVTEDGFFIISACLGNYPYSLFVVYSILLLLYLSLCGRYLCGVGVWVAVVVSIIHRYYHGSHL